MSFRITLIVLLTLFCGQATLSATTTYSFGTIPITAPNNGNGISLASESYLAGVWTENYSGGTGTTQQIVCVVALAIITDTCGNAGPGTAQHIPLYSAPGNTASLPTGTTNYLLDDGDWHYGAPVSTNMTGLVSGATYQISFYQSSNQEPNNNKVYSDSWKVYVIPGANSGAYICLVAICTGANGDPAPTNPPVGAVLAYSSTAMANPGGVSTPWQLQTFRFIATSASETLEFVTNAIGTPGFQPPLLGLSGVSGQVVPEPGTCALVMLGAGVLVAARRLRRRSSTRTCGQPG